MRDPDDTATGDLFAPLPPDPVPVDPKARGRCFLCWGGRPCMEPETCPAEYRQ